MFRTLSVLLICSSFQLAAAQDAAKPPVPGVLVEVQIVAIPGATALPLIRELKMPEKVEAAYERIQTLLENGTAKLIGWPTITTQSGHRAVAEAITEFRYATEYQAGGVSLYVGNIGEMVKEPRQIQGVELDAVPTDFGTRNVGVTLEVEPTATEEGHQILLNLVAQHVRLKGMQKVTMERKGKPKDESQTVVVEQPEFETNKVTTSLELKNGARTLLGVFPSSVPPDHLELFILKAEVR